ncbi:hypothetical protein D3C76_865210 [compost metagenome]
MPEKCSAHQRHYDELFNQFMAEIFHGTVDQLTTIVGSGQLHPGRQTFLQRFKLGLDVSDGISCILPTAQNNHAAHRLALSIKLADAATCFRAQLYSGDIAQCYGYTLRSQAQRNGSEIIK